LFVSVCIAAAALLFNVFSTFQMKRQVDLQQKQWAHSNKPVFRFNYLNNIDKNSYIFIIENQNNKFHQIDKVYCTNSGIGIKSSFNGTLEKGMDTKIIEYHGLVIVLTLKDNKQYTGQIVIEGIDSLENAFKVSSLPLDFDGSKLNNHLEITKTYLLNF